MDAASATAPAAPAASGYGGAPSPRRGKAASPEDLYEKVHPDQRLRFFSIKGPYASGREICAAVNDLTMDKSKCPAGTWKNRLALKKPSTKKRGSRQTLECARCTTNITKGRLKTQTFGFEEADDGNYYLCYVNPDAHEPECLDPKRTDAEQRASGQMHVPSEFKKVALTMRQGYLSTAKINNVLKTNALNDGVDITWNWKHLDHLLNKELGNLGPNADARGVLEWLTRRRESYGLYGEFTTDRFGCLNRLYFEVEGAKERWTRSRDGKMVIFDSTHGTNEYGMKVACFVTLDREGRTQLLGVSILQREDTPSFAWAYLQFKKAMEGGGADGSVVQNPVDIIFTDSDPAMAAAIRFVMPGETICQCLSTRLYSNSFVVTFIFSCFLTKSSIKWNLVHFD